jgi:hypothetical protein
MLRNTPTLETTRRAMRASICAQCPVRPKGSESWETEKPRACETTCRLFLQLGMMREVARQCDPMLTKPCDVITRHVREIKSRTRPDRHGDRPVDGLTRQSRKVVQVLCQLFGS